MRSLSRLLLTVSCGAGLLAADAGASSACFPSFNSCCRPACCYYAPVCPAPCAAPCPTGCGYAYSPGCSSCGTGYGVSYGYAPGCSSCGAGYGAGYGYGYTPGCSSCAAGGYGVTAVPPVGARSYYAPRPVVLAQPTPVAPVARPRPVERYVPVASSPSAPRTRPAPVRTVSGSQWVTLGR